MLAVGLEAILRRRVHFGVRVNKFPNLGKLPHNQRITVIVADVVINNLLLQRRDIARWIVLGATRAGIAIEPADELEGVRFPDSQTPTGVVHQRSPVLCGGPAGPGEPVRNLGQRAASERQVVGVSHQMMPGSAGVHRRQLLSAARVLSFVRALVEQTAAHLRRIRLEPDPALEGTFAGLIVQRPLHRPALDV